MVPTLVENSYFLVHLYILRLCIFSQNLSQTSRLTVIKVFKKLLHTLSASKIEFMLKLLMAFKNILKDLLHK